MTDPVEILGVGRLSDLDRFNHAVEKATPNWMALIDSEAHGSSPPNANTEFLPSAFKVQTISERIRDEATSAYPMLVEAIAKSGAWWSKDNDETFCSAMEDFVDVIAAVDERTKHLQYSASLSNPLYLREYRNTNRQQRADVTSTTALVDESNRMTVSSTNDPTAIPQSIATTPIPDPSIESNNEVIGAAINPSIDVDNECPVEAHFWSKAYELTFPDMPSHLPRPSNKLVKFALTKALAYQTIFSESLKDLIEFHDPNWENNYDKNETVADIPDDVCLTALEKEHLTNPETTRKIFNAYDEIMNLHYAEAQTADIPTDSLWDALTREHLPVANEDLTMGPSPRASIQSEDTVMDDGRGDLTTTINISMVEGDGATQANEKSAVIPTIIETSPYSRKIPISPFVSPLRPILMTSPRGMPARMDEESSSSIDLEDFSMVKR